MQDYLDYKFSFHVWSIESFLSVIMEISILLNFFAIEFLFVLISHAKPSHFIQYKLKSKFIIRKLRSFAALLGMFKVII